MKRISRSTSQKFIIYAIPVSIIGILALLTFTLLVPKIKDIVENYKQLDDKKLQLNKLKKKQNLLDSVSSNATQQLLVSAEQALPQEKDAASILVALENLSASTLFGIDSVTLSPGSVSSPSATTTQNSKIQKLEPITKRNGAQVLEVSVSGRGTTTQLLDFIKNLQNSRRLIDIRSLDFSYNDQAQDLVSADFKLVFYYLTPIQEISQIDADIPQIAEKEQKLLENLSAMPFVSNFLTQLGNTPGPALQLKRTDLFSD